ncbi:MAG: hypothetical protein HOP29_09470 [Phycisphaerales bacterium]|nr:hypothetical protein [Phycisphaerales bacterium]
MIAMRNVGYGVGLVVFGLAAGIGGEAAKAQTSVNVELDIDVVQDELAAYGEWVSVDQHGWVWVPGDVGPEWRPYTRGRWAYCNEFGWTWESSEDWGWATYHYGRWYSDPFHGWAWVPGTEWGPAWVAWRSDGEHVGWAPLPPKAQWRAGIGLDLGGLDIDIEIGSDQWSFVESRYILEPEVYTQVILPARNVTLIRQAPVITRYVASGDRIVNLSLSIERVERCVGRPVPRLQVISTDYRPTIRTSIEGKSRALEVYRPRIARRDPTAAPRVLTKRSSDPNDWAKRQATKEKLEDDYRHRSKEQLESIHRREAAKPQPGVSREALQRRQAVESQALDQDFNKRREQNQKRQEFDKTRRSGAPSAPNASGRPDAPGRPDAAGRPAPTKRAETPGRKPAAGPSKGKPEKKKDKD